MPLIVFNHPQGKSSRVFLSGLGAFDHGIPREVDGDIVHSLLGAAVDGAFARNPLFSLVSEIASELPSALEVDDPDTTARIAQEGDEHACN